MTKVVRPDRVDKRAHELTTPEMAERLAKAGVPDALLRAIGTDVLVCAFTIAIRTTDERVTRFEFEIAPNPSQ